jgi:hypothetical protein
MKPHSQKSSTVGSHNRKSSEKRKLLAGSEAEAPLASRDIEASFRQGYYLHSTNSDRSEWDVMYHQFVESGHVVKSKPTGD